MKKKKIRYYIVLERAQGPTLLDCNYADTCFTAARGSVLAGGCTQVPHRSTYTNRGHLVFLAEVEERLVGLDEITVP